MARSFASASSHRIDLSGGALGGFDGSGTIFAIVRLATNVTGNHYSIVAPVIGGGTPVATFRVNLSSNALTFATNDGAAASTTTLTAVEGWAFVAASKASGTNAPRMHKYVYGTDAWARSDAALTLPNGGTGTDGVGIGYTPGDGRYFNGDISAVGFTSRVLSDDEVSSLPFSLATWWSTSPVALWVLDQSATSQAVRDLTGGGANQTSVNGTSVATASVPILGYGGDPVLVADPPPWDGELANTGGGQADETAVTTGNSAAGGDAWNAVTAAAGAEVTYDDVNSSTWHRFATGATSGQARAEWTSASITAPMPRIYGAFWFRIPAAALGVNNTYLMRARAATVQTTRISISTGNKLQVRNTSNSSAEQGAHNIAADTDYFVRYDVTVGSSAAATVELYAADGTLIETLAPTATNFGTGSVDEVGYGIASNVSSQPAYLLRGFVSSANAWPAPPVSSGVTGTLAATLPTLTASAAGIATVTGTTSATLPALTVDIDGLSTLAALAAILPSLTAATSGTVTVAGTVSATLPALTASAAGTVSGGGLNATLPALTASAAGTATVSGTAVVTLPALTASAAGNVAGGVLSAALPALTSTSAGQVTASGIVGAQLPPLTASAAGTVSFTGILGATLPALLSTFVEGNPPPAGTIAVTLPPLSAAAAGTVSFSGTVSATLPALTVSVGARITVAALDATLPALVATAAGSVVNEGALTATLPALAVEFRQGRRTVPRPGAGTVDRPFAGFVTR